MLSIIRFIKGYVIIRFGGEFGEKLLNIFANNSLNTWNMIYNRGYITGCIDIKSFKKLRTLKRGTKISIKIISKHGLPFFINKNKIHAGLIAGSVLFILIIKLLSSYIWYIDIVGNNRIINTDILKICNEIGIREGVYSKKIDSKDEAIKLIMKNNDIAWASINIEGCRLTVNISETEENTNNNLLPSNIKAKSDGIISSISASNGETLVKIGDTVKKGDILISGIKQTLNSTVFLNSNGSVYAKTIKVYEETKPFKEKIVLTENKVHNKKAIKVFNLIFPLYIGKIGDIKVLRTKTNSLSLFGEKLPVGIITVKYKNAFYKSIVNSKDDILKILNKRIDERIEKDNIKLLNIEKSDTIITDNDITIKREILCEEEIGIKEDIIINTVN